MVLLVMVFITATNCGTHPQKQNTDSSPTPRRQLLLLLEEGIMTTHGSPPPPFLSWPLWLGLPWAPKWWSLLWGKIGRYTCRAQNSPSFLPNLTMLCGTFQKVWREGFHKSPESYEHLCSPAGNSTVYKREQMLNHLKRAIFHSSQYINVFRYMLL